MKRWLILFFLAPYSLLAQDTPLEKFIDSLLAPVNRTDLPGTMILIAQDGKPLVRKAYGMASLELQVAARPDHLFPIASVSKQFTAVAILQLAQKGKLNLSDDIRKYLPGYNTHGKVITIEHLLTHTSGISSSERKDAMDFRHTKGIIGEDFLDYAMKPDLLFAPGTDWSYNNFAFMTAARIVEKISGMPFRDYLNTYVFEPAGMLQSFSGDETLPMKNVVSSYYKSSEGQYIYFPSHKWMDSRGSGSLISSMDDLLKWDIALREEKVLPKEWLEKAWTSYTLNDGRKTNYGYGWIVTQNNGLRFISHAGDIYEYHTFSVHVPEKKLYLLCTTFFKNPLGVSNILRKVAARMLSLPYPQATKAPMPLQDYTGVYSVHRSTSRIAKQITERSLYIHVTTSGDTLYLQETGVEKVALRPVAKDTFMGPTESNFVVFTRDGTGKVASVHQTGIYWSLLGPQVANKRDHTPWPAPVTAKPITPELLRKYAGTYHRAGLPSFYYVLETDGSKLYNKYEGARQELIPVADNKFVRKGVEDISFEFKPGTNGSMVLTVNALRSYDFRKIKEASMAVY